MRPPSLRARVVLAVLFVALAPQMLVFLWTQLDRPVAGRLWFNVVDAMNQTTTAVENGSRYDDVARTHGVRLRVVDANGDARTDEDQDDPISTTDRIEAFFLRPSGVSSLRELDAAAGPLVQRDEVKAARVHSPFVRCDFRELLYCEAIATVKDPSGREVIVHAQQSSFRAVGPVYQLRSQLLRIGLLVWPVAALLAWLTASRIVRPIERLRRQAMERARKDAPLLVHPDRDEVGDLAAALNAAFQTIASERERHDRFVEDLVHELKSPTASVRACAEALQTASDERTLRLAKALDESGNKLEQTVSRFLEVSRAEAGFPREERDSADMSAIAKAVVDAFAKDARVPDVTFTLDAPRPVHVNGIAHRLEAMVHELVENGASFVSSGGRVTVSVSQDEDFASVTVEDDGPGIAPDEVDLVFDRYYTTRSQTRGTGLGLALVRAIATAHGGSARAVAGRASGAAFVVRLPRFTPN